MTQLIINILISFSLFALLANSFSVIYYPTKIFHIAHAAVISTAAYYAFLLVFIYFIPIWFATGVGIIAAATTGVLCELFVYKPMRQRNSPSLPYMIASIGLYTVLQNVISLYFGDDTKVINTAEITVGHQIFGAYITTVQIITICVSFALFIGVNIFLHYTKTGKAIRAVSSNPELCNIYGISSNKIILIAFAIGSALAGVAGILSAMDTNMTPTFGFNLLLYGVVAMIIGGVGSTRGLLAGSLLVATAQNLAAFYLDTKWMDAITYVILILFLIWKPLGFSGKRLKKVEV
jgi:branched-chain amino acid transport system permease protein